jgi:hypothetical protein
MNITVVKLEATVQWMTRQSTTSTRWIGVCEPMRLSMEAESLDELHGVINETMQLLLTDLLRDNELDAFLRDQGWTAQNLPESASEDDVRFDVPWEMITQGTPIDSERRSR